MLERYRLPSLSELAAVLLWRPKFVLIGVAVPSLMIVECVAVSMNNGWETESALKVAGFLIGLAGLSLVAYGLSKTRRLFGKPSVWSRLADWGRAAVAMFVRPPSRPINIEAKLGGVTVRGLAGTILGGPEKTLEQRVKELEEHAVAIKKQLEEIRTEAQQALEAAREEFRTDQGHIRQSVSDLDQRFEKFSVGGLDLEGMGLFWLIFGSALSTFHDRLAALAVWKAFM